MKYHEDRHKCTIDLLRFHKLLDALPEGMKEEVWNDHVLDKHRETIEDKIAEGMDIWNNPEQDVSALRHYVKLYIVLIKHHTQSTEDGVQDIDLCYAGGQSDGNSLAVFMIFPYDCPICTLDWRRPTKKKRNKVANSIKGRGLMVIEW